MTDEMESRLFDQGWVMFEFFRLGAYMRDQDDKHEGYSHEC